MTILEGLKKKYLTYYHERVEGGSKTSVADTLRKYKKLRRSTLNSWIKQEKDNPPQEAKKEDTTNTYTEIVKEKKIDEQINEEHWEMINDPRLEKMLKVIEEEYPQAKELLKENFSQVVEKTLHELDAGVTAKDIKELRNGREINDILNDNRKPQTIDEDIKQETKEQELKKAKMDNIWTGEQLDITQKAFETQNTNPQTNDNHRFFDPETMASLKLLLELQAVLPSLTPSQQNYYRSKFMAEKGVSIFPLLERILYSNIGVYQEPQLHDEEIHIWWQSIPMNERRALLNKLNGQII